MQLNNSFDNERTPSAAQSPALKNGERAKRILTVYSILKYLAVFLVVFLVAVIQTGFFMNLRPLGATPDLCLALCVATALKWGAKKGAIVGIMAGFCLDAFSSVGVSLLIPFYFIISILVGLWAENKNAKGFLYFATAISTATALRVLVSFFMLCLTAPSYSAGSMMSITAPNFSAGKTLITISLPRFIITILLSPLIYLAVCAIHKLFGKRDRSTSR